MIKKNLLAFFTLVLVFNIALAQNHVKKFSAVSTLTKYHDQLLFIADDAVHGPEVWKTDGTAEGTVMVKDINPGSDGSDIKELVVFNDKVYFGANDGVNGQKGFCVRD